MKQTKVELLTFVFSLDYNKLNDLIVGSLVRRGFHNILDHGEIRSLVLFHDIINEILSHVMAHEISNKTSDKTLSIS